MDFKTGGQQVILRLVEAYGFSTRQMLCDHLGVSKSTLATRFMRDIFPAEWVIQCALETGTSLNWLVSGHGNMLEGHNIDIVELPKKKLINGKLNDAGYYFLDKVLYSEELQSPFTLVDGQVFYIVETSSEEINDGKWVIDIDANISVRDLVLLPGKKARIDNGKSTFECDITDINFLAKVRTIIKNLDS